MDLEKAESISIPSESTWKMRWVCESCKGPHRDIRGINPKGIKLFRFDELEGIFLPKDFCGKGTGGIHRNTRLRGLSGGRGFRGKLEPTFAAFVRFYIFVGL